MTVGSGSVGEVTVGGGSVGEVTVGKEVHLSIHNLNEALKQSHRKLWGWK